MTLVIRAVRREELLETSKIYIECFRQDYHFLAREYLEQIDCKKEVKECADWLYHQDASNAIFGIFEGGDMAGYVAVGRDQAEPDGNQGEVCGLFVRSTYRKQGLGIKLLKAGAEHLERLGFTRLVIYNFKQSDSNQYYRKLGGKLVKQETQEVGEDEFEVDVFGWQISELRAVLENRLEKRN